MRDVEDNRSSHGSANSLSNEDAPVMQHLSCSIFVCASLPSCLKVYWFFIKNRGAVVSQGRFYGGHISFRRARTTFS